MSRYANIETVTFDQTSLPLPLSVRLSRKVEPKGAGGDGDLFATSIEISRPLLTAELRLRQTAVAESLSLGQQGDLLLVVSSTRDGSPPRQVTLSGAVLIAVELTYEQSAMATAVLRFVAEAADGQQEPFSAEDVQ